jgi:hypothetical protein
MRDEGSLFSGSLVPWFLGSQFSVLSSWFSVLGSQFAPLHDTPTSDTMPTFQERRTTKDEGRTTNIVNRKS